MHPGLRRGAGEETFFTLQEGGGGAADGGHGLRGGEESPPGGRVCFFEHSRARFCCIATQPILEYITFIFCFIQLGTLAFRNSGLAAAGCEGLAALLPGQRAGDRLRHPVLLGCAHGDDGAGAH